jgi:hypothetical protein
MSCGTYYFPPACNACLQRVLTICNYRLLSKYLDHPNRRPGTAPLELRPAFFVFLTKKEGAS